ncbi:MAG: DUF3880 domain-containing protein [Butyrivibrio sp.]|nr:DUF3880 domain-containing protein [Butyrivibrio sp.]
MKILAYRWKAYNHRDIIGCLEDRGHNINEISGELASFEADAGFEERLGAALEGGKYDSVFSVNYFPLISDMCQKYGVTYISWCCDSPIATMYHQSVFNKVNKIFMFDRLEWMGFRDMGAPVYYLPLCTNAERASRASAPAEGCDADISFVGSMYNKNSYDEIYGHLPEYLKGYFDAAIRMQKNAYSDYLLDDLLDGGTLAVLDRYFVVDRSERSFSDLSLAFSTTVLSYKIAQAERRALIADLSRTHSVNVYTDDEDVDFIKAKNCGLVDYREGAPRVFKRSKINLNLTLRSIRSGVPLRVWDILGAGGFCLTNYQAELPMYFINGEDLVWFKSRSELFELADYYLEHEDERRRIAENGHRKVREFHGYESRMDEIAEYVDGF